MNFLVTPDGPDGSLVSTETRVFANSAARASTCAYSAISRRQRIYPAGVAAASIVRS